MRSEINKLIIEYRDKQRVVTKQLDVLKFEISGLRDQKQDYSHLRKEQLKYSTRLMAYMQAESDFDSLLDYAEE